MNSVKKADQIYLAGTYSRFPVVITGGKGSLLTDENGKEYIDFSSGIAVNTFGAADEEWVSAVSGQLRRIQHTSNLYYTLPQTRLAELLCQKTGMKKVFFSNSGAEANECAIKAFRKYAAEKKGSDYFWIVTLKNSFHGRTVTTLAATGQEVFHRDFQPLTEGFCYAEANNPEDLKRVVASHKTAAIFLECIQGEGGVLPLTREFVQTAASLAKENDILLGIDEVQTGNGRTGKLYSYMHYGITPDIVTTAKGLGGGLPIGATLFGEKTESVFTPGTHGSTFGGNPAVCTGALNVLQRIDDKLLQGVQQKSKRIFSALEGADGIRSVSGMGLMIGVETEKDASEVIEECLQNGLLVIKAKNKVRLLPALNIPDALLDKGLEILRKACEV